MNVKAIVQIIWSQVCDAPSDEHESKFDFGARKNNRQY